MSDLIGEKTKEELIDGVLQTLVDGVFYQKSADYLAYIGGLIGVDLSASVEDFCEIAATRDLVVHNKLIANTVYLSKAKDKSRGALGDTLVIDEAYYENSIKHIKKIAASINEHIRGKYATGFEKI